MAGKSGAQSKSKPAESEENLILLATVESLGERRRNSRSNEIRSKQEEIEKVLCLKPTASDEFDHIRVLHSKIMTHEQKEEATLKKQKGKLQRILVEIDSYACERQKHLDDRIRNIQLRIDGIHWSNLHLLLRVHKRIKKRWDKIGNDEDLDYSNTSSDKDEGTGPDP